MPVNAARYEGQFVTHLRVTGENQTRAINAR
jgi:hypothetical protein